MNMEKKIQCKSCGKYELLTYALDHNFMHDCYRETTDECIKLPVDNVGHFKETLEQVSELLEEAEKIIDQYAPKDISNKFKEQLYRLNDK